MRVFSNTGGEKTPDVAHNPANSNALHLSDLDTTKRSSHLGAWKHSSEHSAFRSRPSSAEASEAGVTSAGDAVGRAPAPVKLC